MEETFVHGSSSNAFSADQKLKVLYVAGVDRSGSTILGTVLGQIDGFFSVGEMQQIWRRGFIENWPCSCGTTFGECPLWQEVVARAFEDDSKVNAEELLNLRGRALRSRHLLPMPTRKSPQERVALIGREYLHAVERLYHGVHAVTQSRVIVDTSKGAAYGYILDTVPSIELYVLHLVRDSRAVAYSFAARRKPEPGLRGRHDGVMPYQGGAQVSLYWNERNYIIERTWGRYPKRYLRMRYEDFVESPQHAIERCLTFLGEEQLPLPAFASKRNIFVGELHNFSGNPDRFRKGITAIKGNDEWKFKMGTLPKLLVTAMTSPWLVRYKYPLFVRG